MQKQARLAVANNLRHTQTLIKTGSKWKVQLNDRSSIFY